MKKVLYALYALIVFAAWILSVGGVLSAEPIACADDIHRTSRELACRLDRSDVR